VNEIKVFYGDASNDYPEGGRNPNANSYDIMSLRQIYRPSWDYIDRSLPNKFATWPPYEIDDWAVSNDYFSFIKKSPSSYGRQCRWDGYNTGVTILSDGGTIRTTDFLTPDGVSSGQTTFPGSRSEVCLHSFYDPFYDGALHYGNEATVFDDFSLRYLHYGNP